MVILDSIRCAARGVRDLLAHLAKGQSTITISGGPLSLTLMRGDPTPAQREPSELAKRMKGGA